MFNNLLNSIMLFVLHVVKTNPEYILYFILVVLILIAFHVNNSRKTCYGRNGYTIRKYG
jgi:di/tricarboxylate transporter